MVMRIAGVLTDLRISLQRLNPFKNIQPLQYVAATITFILLGLGVGYLDLIKSIEFWSNCYYIWDKLKDLFLVLLLQQFVQNKSAKWALKFLSYFFIFRILWDILVITQSFEIAASPVVMFIMFALWTIIITHFMYKGIKDEWQR